MITLHGEEVKVGDKVWHWFEGWGEVTELDDKNTNYPICVQWEEDYEWFTKDGKAYLEEKTPILFWQPIEFETPKKPEQKPKEKAWQWVCKSGDKYWLTTCYYVSKEAVLEQIPKTEPIEPYLPSEIEREVQEGN